VWLPAVEYLPDKETAAPSGMVWVSAIATGLIISPESTRALTAVPSIL
jgi:hypothetical protein